MELFDEYGKKDDVLKKFSFLIQGENGSNLS